MIEQEKPQAYTIEFDRRPNQSPVFIRRQIETHIGERFNVILSKTAYKVKERMIFAEEGEGPFINTIKRGRDYRRGHGNPIDWEREDAEVLGFEKIQDVLVSSATPLGTMMISISPKGEDGSSYQHNFYDIFTKVQSAIEARRYSSALTLPEYTKLLGLDFTPRHSYFLANPIVVDSNLFKTADEIHKFLHKEHDYMEERDFQDILKVCLPLISTYAKDPNALSFNAILNTADITMEEKKKRKTVLPRIFTSEEILALGTMPVRQVMTGCGASGGFSISQGKTVSPFSVSEFGAFSDKYGSLKFNCPHCGSENRRPENKLLSNCQRCGKEVACT